MANRAKDKRVERIIRFPIPLYARLGKVAERNNRSRNAEVMVAVERWVEAEEKETA